MREKKDKSHLVFGTRAVIESIRAGKEVEKLLIQKNLSNDLLKELLELVKERKIPFSRVPQEKLNRISRKNHQGVIGFLSAVDFASLDHVITKCYERGRDPLLLILDRVTDVRNFGAIARTAECAGVDAIIIPSRGSAAIGGDAVKTSAGALNFIPICREPNLENTLSFLQENGIKLVACTEKSDHNIFEIDFQAPLAIIMGSEEDGISHNLMRKVDEKGKIPLHGRIKSLNVSVSAAIALYEAVKQRGL